MTWLLWYGAIAWLTAVVLTMIATRRGRMKGVSGHDKMMATIVVIITSMFWPVAVPFWIIFRLIDQ